MHCSCREAIVPSRMVSMAVPVVLSMSSIAPLGNIWYMCPSLSWSVSHSGVVHISVPPFSRAALRIRAARSALPEINCRALHTVILLTWKIRSNLACVSWFTSMNCLYIVFGFCFGDLTEILYICAVK